MKIPEDKLRYIDLPDVFETFADSLGLITFDGHSGRIELCVTRMDPPKPPNPPTGRKLPVCRLVLTPDTMLQLHNGLKGIIDALEKSGVLKKMPVVEKKIGPPS